MNAQSQWKIVTQKLNLMNATATTSTANLVKNLYKKYYLTFVFGAILNFKFLLDISMVLKNLIASLVAPCKARQTANPDAELAEEASSGKEIEPPL